MNVWQSCVKILGQLHDVTSTKELDVRGSLVLSNLVMPIYIIPSYLQSLQANGAGSMRRNISSPPASQK